MPLPAAGELESRRSSTSLIAGRGGVMTVCDYPYLLKRDQAFVDYLVQLGQELGDPLRLVNNLDDDGQVFGQSENFRRVNPAVGAESPRGPNRRRARALRSRRTLNPANGRPRHGQRRLVRCVRPCVVAENLAGEAVLDRRRSNAPR